MSALGFRAKRVVGAPAKNLGRIGNEHIRAHAAEGVLFRRVLEVAAERNGVACRGFAETELGAPDAKIEALGKKAGPTSARPRRRGWRCNLHRAAEHRYSATPLRIATKSRSRASSTTSLLAVRLRL